MSDEFIHIVFDDLIRSFQTNGSRIALIERDGSTHTYADFKARIVGAQHELKKRSVGKGCKVLVFVPMSVDLYAILEALFSLGATVIFLDPWMKGKKMSQVIRQVQPDLFVVTKKINRLARLLPATWFLKKWKFEHVLPLDGNWEIERVQDAAHALITFTSGTSGAGCVFHAEHEGAQDVSAVNRESARGIGDETDLDGFSAGQTSGGSFGGNRGFCSRSTTSGEHKAQSRYNKQ